jgi:predicted unusual protein kinase regulating ubiquinone biosynthesis (AarF/ABC1/UbiB family)
MASEKEKNSIGNRMARYGRVSTTMAGLAARVVGEKYLGIDIKRDDHARQLTEALGNLKGPLMKVGQILATIPEALPPEYANDFLALQSNAPPMGKSFVRRRMKTELGADWQSKFKTFDVEAIAAASLGQVHKATTHDDKNIACKLQYPDMQSTIEADLNQLKLLFSLYGRYDSSIKTDEIYEELSERLREELDYTLEAKHGKLYDYMLRDEPNVHVPKIINDLSTSRLLCSGWLEGDKILNFKDAPLEDRNQIAMNMFRAWYVPLYYYGTIHGDPHLGNYSVREDHSINLMDFGCVRVFPASFVGAVIDLYRSLQNNDIEQSVHAFETWGFKDITKEQVEILIEWARFLYGPILEDKVRPIGEVTNGIYGREIAESVHTKLKKLGNGVQIPREFVFMDRAALGLGSVFLHLKAEINWFQVFNEMIDGFDIQTLDTRQSEALDKFDIPKTI